MPFDDNQLERVLPAALHARIIDCPDVAVLSEGDDVVAAHVAGCARCREVLLAAAAPVAPPMTTGRWKGLLARARGVFRPRPSDLLRIVVRVVDDALELVLATGRSTMAAGAPSAAMRTDQPQGVLVTQPVGPWDVHTHTSYSRGGGFAILLDMTLRDGESEGSGSGWAGMAESAQEPRITLLRGERELASHVADRGRVMLSGVSPGTYRLQLTHGREAVGGIALELQT